MVSRCSERGPRGGFWTPLGSLHVRLSPVFWTAMTGVAILLLLACVSAANLFVVRSRLPASEAVALIPGVFREAEPFLPVDDIVAVRDRIALFTAQERVLAKLGLVLAGLALGIAIAGVYSAMAGRVTERTQEIGVRMALGASRSAVGMGILRRAASVSGLGIGGGLVLYAWGSRFIEARLYGVASLDPATLVSSALLILAAAWLPARHATRSRPGNVAALLHIS